MSEKQVKIVVDIIKNSGHALINGQHEATARVIVAQLQAAAEQNSPRPVTTGQIQDWLAETGLVSKGYDAEETAVCAIEEWEETVVAPLRRERDGLRMALDEHNEIAACQIADALAGKAPAAT